MPYKQNTDISRSEIKKLWGLAGGMCCFRENLRRCKVQLVKNIFSTNDPTVIGQMAHDEHSEQSKNPAIQRRINEKLSPEKLNSYDNLILLCYNHHKIIDKFQSLIYFSLETT